MENEAFVKLIKESLKKCEESGQFVVVDHLLPTVQVNRSGDPEDLENEYFFQGEEACQLIDDAEGSLLHEHLTVEEIIMWQAQGW